MATVYVETSIVSYLRRQPSSQIVVAARQLLTRQWWTHERNNYALVTSQYVLDEASAGDAKLAKERVQLLAGIPLLPIDSVVENFASEVISRDILPPKAVIDALHIALVARHTIDYLLTWNCTHIANARTLPRIHSLLMELDLPIPIICTPEEMVGYDEP